MKHRKRGFTLIEIMLVVGIISVLMGAAVYYMSGNLDVAKEERVRADLSNIGVQLKTYEMLNLFLPTTEQGLKALVEKPETEPQPKRWKKLMEEVPIDPWGMPYQYRYPGLHNTDSFDLYSLGPDRVESADDIGNWKK
jgi:general secretion pathway protein G